MSSADALRAGIAEILSGGGGAYPGVTKGAAAHSGADPFAQPNEWEVEQRKLKKEEQRQFNGAANQPKPWEQGKLKSRRAQQEAAKANAKNGASAAVKEAASKDAKAGKSPQAVEPAEKQLLPACSAWWEELQATPASAKVPGAKDLGALRARAATAYEAELGAFAVAQKRKHGKDQSIVQRLTSAGTIKDRIAALTVQVHESSFHCLPHLRQLVALAERPRPEVRMAACETLSDLLLHRLMPQRTLKAFAEASLPPLSALPPAGAASGGGGSSSSSAEEALRVVLQAHFENELKELYARFVSLVEEGAKDTLAHVKQRMIGTLYALLAGAPELERRLLSSLVNKLGDPDKKAASRLAHLLGQLTVHHPAMKAVVLAELQRFVLRPNVSESAQYYAVVFMNQLILTRNDPQLAHTLLLIFLALFSARTAQGAELGTRMLSSILSGLHRAIPFCDDPATKEQTGELLASQLTSLFRCAHAASFGTAVQALMVLSHATSFTPAASDRFYRALYASLLHPDLPTSGKQALLLNVVFKALKADESHTRTCAFAKRLLQACAHAPPSFICGALLLLSEVARRKPALHAMLSAPQPTAAATNGHAATVNGNDASDDDEEEDGEKDGKDGGGDTARYEWSKRDPLYCAADASRLWELTALLGHYHPSVVQFANQVAKGEPVAYAGDPLRDFGLMPFLDKFVFKNPKSARRKQAGGSIMQPAAHNVAALGVKGLEAEMHDSALSNRGAVANLLSKPAERVAAHERFFHTYFSRKRDAEEKLHRGRPGKAAGAATASTVGDDDDFGDDGLGVEGEAFAQRLAKSLMRDADPDGDDDDDDMDMDDDDDDDDEGDGEEDEDVDFDGEFDDEIPEEGEDDDDDEDDALALAAFGDGGDDQDGDDDAPVEKPKSKRKKRDKGGPTFADAEAFAHILEAAADEDDGVHPQLAGWERGDRKKRKR